MSNDNNVGNLLNTLKNIETEIIGDVVDNEKTFFKIILKKFINLKIALDIKSRKHDELMSGWNECVVEIEDYDSTTKICNIITANDDVLEVHYYSNFKTPYTFRGEKIKSDLDVSKYYYIINYYLDMDSNIDSDEKEVILNTFKTNYMLSLLEDYDLLPLESQVKNEYNNFISVIKVNGVSMHVINPELEKTKLEEGLMYVITEYSIK